MDQVDQKLSQLNDLGISGTHLFGGLAKFASLFTMVIYSMSVIFRTTKPDVLRRIFELALNVTVGEYLLYRVIFQPPSKFSEMI